jgi:hypothetical protein
VFFHASDFPSFWESPTKISGFNGFLSNSSVREASRFSPSGVSVGGHTYGDRDYYEVIV